MNNRQKKAALCGLLGYLAVTGLACGMLKTALVTRKTLYGGQPVMAQVTRRETADGSAYDISLGGGEWKIALTETDGSTIQRIAEALPPGLFRWIFRMAQLAGHTAEAIATTSKFCS